MPRRNAIEESARIAWMTLSKLGVRSLLSKPISNPKVKKNIGVGVLTAPLHLSPASSSGFNVCPMATAGCIKACLHTAGNPAHMSGKRKARNARTRAYFKARDEFMQALAGDIERLRRQARKRGLRCAVRLNATSDIVWERMPVTIGERVYPNLMTLFGNVMFYDYSKRHNRTNLPSNYSLTYSLAENNDAHAIEALGNGMNVAAVFNIIRGHPLPSHFTIGPGFTGLPLTVPVIDGDEHDYRPIDPKGVIVGLRAKGRARYDRSGFVRNAFPSAVAA